MVKIPKDGKGKTSLDLPAFEVRKDEMPRSSRLQVRATVQEIRSELCSLMRLKTTALS